MKTGKRGRKWGREGKVRKGGGREGKVFAKPLRWAKSFGGNSLVLLIFGAISLCWVEALLLYGHICQHPSLQTTWLTSLLRSQGNPGEAREPTIPVSPWALPTFSLPLTKWGKEWILTSHVNVNYCLHRALRSTDESSHKNKKKSVITSRMVIESHLALETDQAGMLNHETQDGQIVHLL